MTPKIPRARALPVGLAISLALAGSGRAAAPGPLVPVPPIPPHLRRAPVVLARIHRVSLGEGGLRRIRRYRLVRAGAGGRLGPPIRFRFPGGADQAKVPVARLHRDGATREVRVEVGEPAGVGPAGETELVVVPPPTREGDLLEVVLEREVPGTLEGRDFAPSHYFGAPLPVLRDVFEVEVPRGQELRYLSRGMGERSSPHVVRGAEGTTHRWSASVLLEDSARPGQRPYVRTTLLDSWAPVSSWYRDQLAGRIAPTPELTDRARDLARGAVDPFEVARRIVAWVGSSIAYRDWREGGVGDVCGRSAALVLRRGFGNCADQTNLLVTLLRLAGIEASPVLASSSAHRPLDPEVPTYFPGDHVLTRVRLGDQDYFVDPTASGYRFPHLPPAFRRSLVWDPLAGTFLATPSLGEDEVRRSFEGRLDAEGRLVGTARVELHGHPEARLRRRLRERRVRLEDAARSLLLPATGRILSVRADRPEDRTRPLVLEADLELPLALTREARLLLPVPFPRPSEADEPGARPGIRVVDEARIRLPVGAAVTDLPRAVEAEARGSRFRSAWTATPGKLQVVADYHREEGIPAREVVEARKGWASRVLSVSLEGAGTRARRANAVRMASRFAPSKAP